jgi:hypothetical protein
MIFGYNDQLLFHLEATSEPHLKGTTAMKTHGKYRVKNGLLATTLILLFVPAAFCASRSKDKAGANPDPYANRPGSDYMPLSEGYYKDCKNKFLQGIEPIVWHHPVSGNPTYFVPADEWHKRYWEYQKKLKEEEAKKKAEEEARKKEEAKKKEEELKLPEDFDKPQKLPEYEDPKNDDNAKKGGYRSLLWDGNR